MAKIDEAINALSAGEIQLLNSDPQMLSEFKNKYGDERVSLVKKVWGALGTPERMSEKGFQELAKLAPSPIEPTGDLPRDIVVNLPNIISESAAETAGKIAPGFISPTSMLTTGVLKGLQAAAPAVKSVGRTLAKGGESITGLAYKTPGVLKEAYKDPSLMLGPGREKAIGLFEGIKNPEKIRPGLVFAEGEGGVLGGPLSNDAVVEKALGLARAGDLAPEEALVARRSLDAVKKGLAPESYKRTRDIFDGIAKTISAEADKAYVRAIKSEALRQIRPHLKGGGPSSFNTYMGLATLGLKGLGLQSPALYGAAASGAGFLGRGVVEPAVRAPLAAGTTIGSLVRLAEQRYGKPKK